MYDIREELMRKMVSDLTKEKTEFEIISDEDFYNSEYGYRRRRRNETCSSVVYMHCLVPGNEKNLLGVYFHKKDICIAAPMFFEDFVTSIDVNRTVKKAFKNPYIEFRVIRKDYDDMYEDTKLLILELLEFARNNNVKSFW